jgi:hypothetical protein
VVVKAHEEDEVEFLPIWTGRLPELDPEKVPKGHNLGGKTLGEELGECKLLEEQVLAGHALVAQLRCCMLRSGT